MIELHEYGDGCHPDVAIDDQGRWLLAYREGDPREPGRLVVRREGEADPIYADALGSGSPAYPRVCWPWLAYSIGDAAGTAVLVRLDSGETVTWPGLSGSNPLALNATHCAWQASPDRRLMLRSLELGVDYPLSAFGKPDGIASVSADWTITLVADIKTSVSGMTNPWTAGPLTVGEGQGLWDLARRDDGRELRLWEGLESCEPHCAMSPDGTRAVVAAWGSQRLRLAIMTHDEFQTPAPPVVDVPPIAPLHRPVWVGAWEALDYRPSWRPAPLGYQQDVTIVHRAEEAQRSPWPVIAGPTGADAARCLVALHVETQSQDEMIAAVVANRSIADRLRRPILAVCDCFLPSRPVPGADWLGLELYARTPTEPAADVAARVRQVMDALPATQALALIVQAYDRRTVADGPAWYQGDLIAMQEIGRQLANDPRVVAILGHSFGRPGGIAWHPELAQWWQDLARAVQWPAAAGIARQVGVVVSPEPWQMPTISRRGRHRLIAFSDPSASDGKSYAVDSNEGSLEAVIVGADGRELAHSRKRREFAVMT